MRVLLWLLPAILAVAGCSDGSDDTPFNTVPRATVEAPPEGGAPFLAFSLGFDIGEVGYEKAEFFLSGTATSFRTVGEATDDGYWTVEPVDEAAYRTRMVVHRPSDPSRFSGTVIVEWLNVSGGLDAAVSYITGHVEMHRAGHVWVGVSAQRVGVDGDGPLSLLSVDPERYGTLLHPGDKYSYDIFAQAARALRFRGDNAPLRGLNPRHVWAVGESQSAFRLTTFVNALEPYYEPYDGYLIFSRGGAGAPLLEEEGFAFLGAQKIRDDVATPVLVFQAEGDVLFGFLPARQDDSPSYRLWEVAGTSHSDLYTSVTGPIDVRGEARFARVEENLGNTFFDCSKPVNSGPMHFVFNAAIRAMDNWVRSGEAPAPAARLDVSDSGTGFLRDQFDNVTGGVRSPHLDAPVATLRGDGNSFACILSGTTRLFSPELMASLYVDAAGYTAAVQVAADSAVARGQLVREDADAIIAWAPQQWSLQVAQ